ncbi:MAG: type VI secretion system-associated FHA domain protein TagH [Steroidobacteraceae bacterium]|jgi:type VI secretion system FHA domain protein|nr:type VI secretion system-associated FHA domain protein TagH [Steroidobacteraceae bacterium]
MALRLRVVSEHRRALGPRATVVFGAGGGTIGRSAENDWILPDPSRYISGRHGRILFRHGSWFFEDTSTNGTYLNDTEAPIPKQTPCELRNGDVLVLGEYHVVVSIDSSIAGSPDQTAGVDLERELLGDSGIRAAATLPPQVEGHLDASLNTSALFSDAARSDSFRVGNAFGQAVVVPFGSTRAAARAVAPTENSDIIAARRLERLQRLAGERDGQGSGHGDARAGFEALCRGAGLDPATLPQDGAAAMLQLAGRLLREAIVGLKDLDLKQREQAQAFGLAALRSSTEDPPFRFATPADELLVQMLASHDSRRLDAGQWLRQNFDQAKRHDEGLAAGARAACAELIRQLEPRDLEARFERSATRNLVGARPSNWELYRELHRTLTESPAQPGMPHVAAERFAAAYDEAIRPPPRE